MSNNYYSETAFNSRSLRSLPAPRQKSELSSTQKLIRMNLVTSRGQQCREYLSYAQLEFIELLNDSSEQNLKEMRGPGQEFQEWASVKNPRAVAEVVRNIFGFFFFGTILTAILLLVIRKFEFVAIYYSAVMVSIPYSVYFILGYGIRRNWFKDKNNIIVSRRTGLVTFTWDKERVTLPFDEFDVCMPMGTRPTGSHDYYLRFVHKYSDKWFQAPAGRDNAWEVEQDWEFWQQYMDISQPLPDIPKMEPFRDRDPVTAQWDIQHHRPKDYWKHLPMDKAETMRRQSRQAAESFPWGQTRDQALAQGWQPSGVGEGDWRKISN
jgi:hypothetical protein